MPGSARRPPDRGLRGAANPVRALASCSKTGRAAPPTRPRRPPPQAAALRLRLRVRRRAARQPDRSPIAGRRRASLRGSSPSSAYACGSQCSASALARSMRLRLPCSTRISPMRPPVVRCTSRALWSSARETNPSSTKISPIGRRASSVSGALVGHRLELPRVAVAAVHPRGIGTEAVEVQRNRACTRLSRRRAGRPRSRRRRRRPARGRGGGASSGCGRRGSSPSSR